MKLFQFLISGHFSNLILYVLMLANIDYVGILDYGLKAFVGSLIWFGFRYLGDRLLDRDKQTSTAKGEKSQNEKKQANHSERDNTEQDNTLLP
jgi:hypothetical protein